MQTFGGSAQNSLKTENQFKIIKEEKVKSKKKMIKIFIFTEDFVEQKHKKYRA